VPTPTVAPPAQGAVDAYITLLNLYNEATRDPRPASLSAINRYLDGKALTLFDHSLSAMIKNGYAYRGTPDSPRLKIASVLSPTAVFLSSCPLTSRSDPFIEYDIKTGKAIPVPTRTPPPPYLLTITMKRVGGQWKITDLLQNTSKTCNG
jgi:hypothetical protein